MSKFPPMPNDPTERGFHIWGVERFDVEQVFETEQGEKWKVVGILTKWAGDKYQGTISFRNQANVLIMKDQNQLAQIALKRISSLLF